MCVCGGVGAKPKRKPCTWCLCAAKSAGSSCDPQCCCSSFVTAGKWELSWAELVCFTLFKLCRAWERSGVEERGYPCTIAQGFCWGIPSLHSVLFSVICVPCHCAKGSRRELPVSLRVVTQTQSFLTPQFTGLEGDIGGNFSLLKRNRLFQRHVGSVQQLPSLTS